ncbi:photosystem II stability/assembly factor-like uncharacterized protein [Bradyrhizobium sp. AZCC 1578]|uniref:WD40/YVTN/BNR-like repeat-containing protein n=1 Tax=Bradyrhizobium sp. AZCC 1578 TaxID=3117027 RepID=UPI002FF22B55
MTGHGNAGSAGYRFRQCITFVRKRVRNFARVGSVALVIALLFGAGTVTSIWGNEQDGRVVGLTYDPGTDALLKAYGHVLYRSTDQGTSWQTIAIAPLKDRRISSFAVSPAGKGILYVTGAGVGVLRSDDGGNTWVERNEGLASRDVIAVAAHTTQPETAYTVLKDRGVYRSQDGGHSWRLMDRTSQQGLRQLIHSNMPGSMQTGWLFAAASKGVHRAMDCFCLWQTAGKLDGQAYAVTYDPGEPKHLYAATERGLFSSPDGGENWVPIKSPTSEIIGLAFTRSGVLFAIDADSDLYNSTDGGVTWIKANA